MAGRSAHLRPSRSAYWWFALFQGIVVALWSIVIGLAESLGTNGSSALAVLSLILVCYLALTVLALLVRRLHDTDRSGWWILISPVPYVGGIILLVLTVLKGTSGPNRYSHVNQLFAGKPASS